MSGSYYRNEAVEVMEIDGETVMIVGDLANFPKQMLEIELIRLA
jgi:hypothetical protein